MCSYLVNNRSITLLLCWRGTTVEIPSLCVGLRRAGVLKNVVTLGARYLITTLVYFQVPSTLIRFGWRLLSFPFILPFWQRLPVQTKTFENTDRPWKICTSALDVNKVSNLQGLPFLSPQQYVKALFSMSPLWTAFSNVWILVDRDERFRSFYCEWLAKMH